MKPQQRRQAPPKKRTQAQPQTKKANTRKHSRLTQTPTPVKSFKGPRNPARLTHTCGVRAENHYHKGRPTFSFARRDTKLRWRRDIIDSTRCPMPIPPTPDPPAPLAAPPPPPLPLPPLPDIGLLCEPVRSFPAPPMAVPASELVARVEGGGTSVTGGIHFRRGAFFTRDPAAEAAAALT